MKKAKPTGSATDVSSQTKSPNTRDCTGSLKVQRQVEELLSKGMVRESDVYIHTHTPNTRCSKNSIKTTNKLKGIQPGRIGCPDEMYAEPGINKHLEVEIIQHLSHSTQVLGRILLDQLGYRS